MLQHPPLPRPLWMLPLAIALLPVVATHLALWLSIMAGQVPACIPYLEGCTSISRAARHGLANTLFKSVMLPVAALHLANWVLARRWLAMRHPDPRAAAALLPLGIVAALALALYAWALGSDGDFYRWMRRFGIVFYFGSSYLAQLVFLHRLAQLADAPRAAVRGMRAIALILLLMGLASTWISNVLPDPALKDRLENLLEWHLGLLMTLWFLLQAKVFRRGAGG